MTDKELEERLDRIEKKVKDCNADVIIACCVILVNIIVWNL